MDVLVTHRNQGPTVRDSIRDLLRYKAPDDRIIVVDANSSDGSLDTLERLSVNEGIVLKHVPGASRGRGRQSAFEAGDNDIVAAHIDMDASYSAGLFEAAEYYRELRRTHDPGLVLFHGGMIADRSVVADAGGWRDLDVHEDKDLWVRADADAPVYRLPVSVVDAHHNFEWDSWRYRQRRRYQNYRDALRLGVGYRTLVRSLRHHLPSPARYRDRTLLALAAQRATAGDLGGFEPGDFNPETHFLRELRFEALVAAGLLSPTVLDVPDRLADYARDDGYPARTSYDELVD
ncbi:glycosyltransferase [Halosegnis marinus]|uniref:Glycosyltransferase n=1 Tax=Halosegnis marinus TaxID=3034023 RepID=A0ABD5ZN33_9EURY|nr:glycosyltransferase family A protein [Halosegnis sp. DT85]